MMGKFTKPTWMRLHLFPFWRFHFAVKAPPLQIQSRWMALVVSLCGHLGNLLRNGGILFRMIHKGEVSGWVSGITNVSENEYCWVGSRYKVNRWKIWDSNFRWYRLRSMISLLFWDTKNCLRRCSYFWRYNWTLVCNVGAEKEWNTVLRVLL